MLSAMAQEPKKNRLGEFLEKAGQTINNQSGTGLNNDEIIQGLK